jgi:pimeloyl-ACP methyl ester carboxylesterase
MVAKAMAAMLVVSLGLIGGLASAASTVAGARLTSEPVYTAAPCPDPNVPELGPGTNLSPAFTCGELTVPENRANPNGRTIRLAVARVPATTATPRPDPIVFLTGGPGGIAFLDAPQAVASGMNADREVIFVAHRGTYHADPFLTCPAYDDYLNDSLGLHFSDPATGKLDEASVRASRSRQARTGVNVSASNAAENAADIAGLRVALGIAEWNVYGVSYGTDFAQWLLRDHPAGIRSAVLGSMDAAVRRESLPCFALLAAAPFSPHSPSQLLPR